MDLVDVERLGFGGDGQVAQEAIRSHVAQALQEVGGIDGVIDLCGDAAEAISTFEECVQPVDLVDRAVLNHDGHLIYVSLVLLSCLVLFGCHDCCWGWGVTAKTCNTTSGLVVITCCVKSLFQKATTLLQKSMSHLSISLSQYVCSIPVTSYFKSENRYKVRPFHWPALDWPASIGLLQHNDFYWINGTVLSEHLTKMQFQCLGPNVILEIMVR